MTSADFSAAQERLAARAKARAAAAGARDEARKNAHAASLSRLPAPLRGFGAAGLSAWDSVKGREGTRPAFRVGQVDAELLDEELLDLLKGQVGEGLKFLGSHLRDDYSAEIVLALRAILFKLTIWDHNASYGAALQGLRYADSRNTSPARTAPRPWQKVMYGLVTVGGRYAWTKWEDWLVDQEGGYDEPSPVVRRLSRLTGNLTMLHSVAALASFLTFLLNGRFRTVLDRLLRLRLTPTSSHTSREVSFEYLNRQLVWHAFTEFLLFLLPLVGIARWRRLLSRAYRRITAFLWRTFRRGTSSDGEEDDKDLRVGELGFLPKRTCGICYQDQTPTAGSEAEILAASGGGVAGSATTDITNPYAAIPCGCVYCYVCLAQRLEAEEGEGWTCLRCGEVVEQCCPWDGDVLEEKPSRPSSGGNSGKVVGFADDAIVECVDDEKEERELRNVDPMPEQDDSPEDTPRIGDSILGESSSWTQASGSSEGERSDEEEEDNGELE